MDVLPNCYAFGLSLPLIESFDFAWCPCMDVEIRTRRYMRVTRLPATSPRQPRSDRDILCQLEERRNLGIFAEL